jgi:hypothetical protein
VNDGGFIFLLSLGASLLVGIVVVAHVTSHRLSRRLAERRARATAEEPELDFGGAGTGYAVKARQPLVMHAEAGSRF